MKNTLFAVKFSFCLIVILLAAGAIRAQQEERQPEPPPQQSPNSRAAAFARRQLAKRPGLLRLLNLSREQIEQIRAINFETRTITRAANQRQRQARRLLDAAIYADAPSQAEVEQRARELAEAQSEAVKLRAVVEFRVRQILTNEQLIRFRQLRQEAVSGER